MQPLSIGISYINGYLTAFIRVPVFRLMLHYIPMDRISRHFPKARCILCTSTIKLKNSRGGCVSPPSTHGLMLHITLCGFVFCAACWLNVNFSTFFLVIHVSCHIWIYIWGAQAKFHFSGIKFEVFQTNTRAHFCQNTQDLKFLHFSYDHG